MWTTIRKIIPFNINKLGLGHLLAINEISSGWNKMISCAIGENCKNKARPVSLKDKVLTVDCLNSVWASELQFKQAEIIKEINKNLKREAVSKIVFIS